MEQQSGDLTPEQDTEARLSRLRPGAVLLATDVLKDPNFDAAMVLVCLHGSDGAYGLVLNRPSHMPVSEMFDGFSGVEAHRKIYMGGPVQQEAMQIVQVTQTPADGAHQVSDGVYMGGQWDDAHAILGTEDASLRLFLGYSGWAPGQLEQEILKGAWEVFDINAHVLLRGPEEPWYGTAADVESYLRQLTIR